MVVDGLPIMHIDKYSKLKIWLNESGCIKIRNGKGAHEIWKTYEGRTIIVPHHNQIKRRTLRQIVKMVNGTWNR